MPPFPEPEGSSKADKFAPPPFDATRLFFREKLCAPLRNRIERTFPHLVLEARAGQGKSLLIHHLLTALGANALWFRVDQNDRDPAHLLRALRACLTGQSRGQFADPAWMDHEPFEVQLTAVLGLADSLPSGDQYLVFDDAHHLLAHPDSMRLLWLFLLHLPKRLHCILSSREALPIEWRGWGPGQFLRLGNRDLALDEEEIVDFVRHGWGLLISRQAARQILRVTEGWITGVRVLGKTLARCGTMTDGLDSPDAPGGKELFVFFRLEVLSSVAESCRKALMSCALVDEVPADLAVLLAGDVAIAVCLKALARREMFLRVVDTEQQVYALHPMFQQFLRGLACTELSRAEIGEIYGKAGAYWEERGDLIRALQYLTRATDNAALESFLEKHGGALLAANQTETLSKLLEHIPKESLHQQGWSLFFLALAKLDSVPEGALPLLSRAREVFAQRQDRIGELLCLAHIISIHIVTTGHYREGEVLLRKTGQLFFETAANLDAEATILVARSLAMGYCIFYADVDEATRFASLAMGLARKKNLVNFEAALLLVNGYIHIFAGHTVVARTCLEQAFLLMRHPDVGPFNTLSIRMMLFNFLFHEGDFFNYFEQKNQMIETVGSSMVAQSIAGPFCFVWEMDIAISQGRFAAALDIAEQVQALHATLSPHLLGQILQLKALVLARQGDEQAVTVALESQRLRELSGGRYFIALNTILVGHVLACRGQYERGLELLGDGIATACQMPTAYLEACGRLHRAEALLKIGMREQASEDISLALGLMRRNAYRHLWGWTPEARETVLRFAAAERIEVEYARTLATQLDVALRDDGSIVPLLEFKTLGGLRIVLQSRTLLRAEDLTPAQRELLGMLLASPELKISVDALQLHLWPDSAQETIRIKCDTLVSRLRKALTEALPDAAFQGYLCRGKGMLWLEHCRVDAAYFAEKASQGMKHVQLQEFWQAGNAFAQAEALWGGEFLPEVMGNDRLRAYRVALTGTFSALACAWAELLHVASRTATAERVLEKGLCTDPLNENLYRLLFLIKGHSSAVSGRQVLKRFSAQLRQEGYPEREIEGVVAGILAASDR